MKTTRRDFIRYCGVSAATLGLTASEIGQLAQALANPNGPKVLWLQGASCTGCSVSLLNLVSSQAPADAADLLIDSIDLTYHPTLMAAAGDTAVDRIRETSARPYVLVVEGGIPTAFGGAACGAWSYGGHHVTFADAIQQLAPAAQAVLAVGNCAAWGGIPAAGSNPTGVYGVRDFTRLPAISVPGCPPHPDWIVWPIAQLLLGRTISLDSLGRPRTLFRRSVHDDCPRKGTGEAREFGERGCLKALGCRGPETKAPCPSQWWNGGVNWCIGAGSPCHGCTSEKYPGSEAFVRFRY